jgi:hypothetical protein
MAGVMWLLGKAERVFIADCDSTEKGPSALSPSLPFILFWWNWATTIFMTCFRVPDLWKMT